MSDYDAFVEKFKPKLTTDDCYTPPAVMQAVVDYVASIYPLEGLNIMRPFYPGGDYENETYADDCIVIDNPPFSIVTAICRFYQDRGVKFFLFAPQLTLFNPEMGFSYVISDSSIIYENGANVKTAFITNVFDEPKIIGAPDLHRSIKEAQKKEGTTLPVYVYPDNVITVSKIAYIVNKGVPIEISGLEVSHIRSLDSQRPHKKSVFGSGFLVSDKAAAAAAAAAVKNENEKAWELSEREKQIIKHLNDWS